VEGGNRADLVGLSAVTHFISLNGAEDHLRVLVRVCEPFERRFKVHAGAAVARPKVDDHSWVVAHDFGKVGLARDLEHLTNLRSFKAGSLLLTSHSATELVHQILHHIWVDTWNVGHSSWHPTCTHTGHARLTWLLGWGVCLVVFSLVLLVILKNGVRPLHKIILHARQHRCELFAHWRLHQLLGQINNIFGDALTEQQISNCISEIVAVICQDVVFLGGEIILHAFQHFHEVLLRNFCHSQVSLLCWLTERGLARLVIADTTAKVELLAVNDDASVPNTFELAPNELLRELLTHAIRQIVHIQRHRENLI